MIEYAVLGGFVLDCLFGDPAWLPHPVVYMGKAISALEKRLRARLPKTPQGELPVSYTHLPPPGRAGRNGGTDPDTL